MPQHYHLAPVARLFRPALLALAVLLVTGCGGGKARLRVERVPGSGPGVLAVPAAGGGEYHAELTASTTEPITPAETADSATAAAEVREGRLRYALTHAAAAADLATEEFAAVPVALIVPLTFPVEEVTAAQARALVAGRVRDWAAVGGPATPVIVAVPAAAGDLGTVRTALGEAPAAATQAAGTDLAPGVVRVEPWSGRALDRKALRVAGALPGEPEYPFVDRRVVAAREPDRAQAERLAGTLRQRLDARRPVEVTLDAVGDIMLARSIGRQMAERGPAFPFERVQPVLATADVRTGNLELPLTERGAPAAKDYVFRAPPSVVAGLRYAGFDVLSLANNHTLDYGPEGLLDTLATLERAGIASTGAGRTPEEAHAPAIITVKGLRLAFLSYVTVLNDHRSGWVAESMVAAPGRPGVAWGTPEAIRRDVEAAKRRADLVIVSVHSGWEYQPAPAPTQVGLAHAAVDAGAALVLGAHPHVLQGLEFYRGVPIIYSLGNFVFDLDEDDYRQPGLPSILSVIFRVTLTARGAQSVRFIPAVIDAREGRPVPVTGAEARPVLQRLYALTEALQPNGVAGSAP